MEVEGRTDEVVEETSSGRDQGGFTRGVFRDRGCWEREGQNKIELVLVQAPVPLGKICILLDKQLAFLLDGRTLSKSFKEGGPVVIPPNG